MKMPRKMPHRVKEYLLTIIIFLVILFISVIPDYIYYNTDLWMSGKPFAPFCNFFWKMGISYTKALSALNSNFGILVTAISVIITMSVNNLNRSENKFFGLTREQFSFSRRQVVYQYGRRMVLFAPLVMFIVVNIGYCIAGYAILLWCYLFLIIAYLLFESSFSREKDLDCIVRKLLESTSPIIQDMEDITDYLMLLNTMRQWNEKEKYWEGVNYLFRELCSQAVRYDLQKRYILCQYFYGTMYIQDNDKDYDRAVYALKDYVIRRDKGEWKSTDFLLLWGMMHCLFERCDRINIVRFIKWYMDFPARSRNVVRECSQEKTGYNPTIDMQTIRKQTGILLIEMELYLHRHKKDVIDNYILEQLSQIWHEGKILLDENNGAFRQQYLNINAMHEFDLNEIEMRLGNLCSDYQYNTTKSLLVYYLKYNQEESDGYNM